MTVSCPKPKPFSLFSHVKPQGSTQTESPNLSQIDSARRSNVLSVFPSFQDRHRPRIRTLLFCDVNSKFSTLTCFVLFCSTLTCFVLFCCRYALLCFVMLSYDGANIMNIPKAFVGKTFQYFLSQIFVYSLLLFIRSFCLGGNPKETVEPITVYEQ